MKAIGYFVEGARVNGAERSLSDQTERFLAFCQKHGYQVAATFVDTKDADEAKSGFRQMLGFTTRVLVATVL